MPPLANRNNNPGDLRFIGQVAGSQGQGGFASFPTPEDGTAALLNDIQSKINKNPNETLDQFSHVYAPEDDGNDSMQYAANLANQMGVSPDTNIGSLESKIGEFAAAIAKNEGYKTQDNSGAGNIINPNTASQAAQTGGQISQAAGETPGLLAGGGILAGLGAALGPEIGVGEEALSGIGNLAKGALGSVASLFEGKKTSTPSEQTAQQQAPDIASTLAPSTNETATETNKPSGTYNALSGMLSSMVGGQQILQEGKNRGIDPVQVLEQTGASSFLQPDENGNLDKNNALNHLNSLLSQDKTYQNQMVQGMSTPVNLDILQQRAEAEVESAMQDSGEKQRALKEVRRIFDDYRAEQPDTHDEQGNIRVGEDGKPVKSSYILPARLQKKKELLSVSEKDFARPIHERSAATHVKESMRKHLSEIAQREGVKDWDVTNRRLEAMVLAKKAVKKLPKKAARNRMKEFRKDLMASIAGGAVGKLMGHGLAGTVAGHLIERQLGKNEYKSIGSKKEQKKAQELAKKHPKESLAGIKPRQKKS